MSSNRTGGRGAFCARLPFGGTPARTARRMVGALLAEVDASPRLVEDSLLVVHELVVNGVSHGRPDEQDQIEVSCFASADEVQISVLDHGLDGEVAPRSASEDRPNGRGLAIVAALSDAWAVDRSCGTRVSARLAG